LKKHIGKYHPEKFKGLENKSKRWWATFKSQDSSTMKGTESMIDSTLNSGVPTPNKRPNTASGDKEVETVDFKAKLQGCLDGMSQNCS
jgi:hypothetical protein